MKRKQLLLSTSIAALCLAVVAVSLILSGFGHSHAAAATSATAGQHSTIQANSPPASFVVQGNVYYGLDSSSAYALNATTGNLLWRHSAGSPVDLGTLTVVNNRVYFSADHSRLSVLQASTGVLLWSYEAQGLQLWSPLVINGSVYLSTYKGMYAFKDSDGSQLWHYHTSINNNNQPGFIQPGFVINGVVYFSAINYPSISIIHALRASDGTQLWHYSIQRSSSIPAISNGVVYVITNNIYPHDDSTVYALRANDGSFLWKYALTSTSTGNGQSTLTVVAGMVYVFADIGHGDFSLSALNASNGSLVWPSQQAIYVVSYAVVNGVMYLSNGATVYAFNAASGAQLWSYQPSNTSARILVANNIVYVIADGGPISALKTSDGSVLWSYQPQDGPFGFLTSITNGVLYAGSNFHVYAINASTGAVLWSHLIAKGIATTPLLLNGIVYVTSAGDSVVHALDGGNGTQLWFYPR